MAKGVDDALGLLQLRAKFIIFTTEKCLYSVLHSKSFINLTGRHKTGEII